MSRSAAQREAAVSRKRRQRQRERQAALVAAAARAARQEAADEAMVPAIMRNPIMSGEHMLLGPRVRILNGRPERCDPIANARHPEFAGPPAKDFGQYNAELEEARRIAGLRRWAARKLQLDWHDVGCGANATAVDYLRSGGGSGGSGEWYSGHNAMVAQIDARQRLEGAMAHLGAFAPGVCRVVLDCVPISAWVLEVEPVCSVQEGVAWIALALDRLVLFYNPPAPVKKVVIRTIGPGRGDYSTEVGDERV